MQTSQNHQIPPHNVTERIEYPIDLPAERCILTQPQAMWTDRQATPHAMQISDNPLCATALGLANLEARLRRELPLFCWMNGASLPVLAPEQVEVSHCSRTALCLAWPTELPLFCWMNGNSLPVLAPKQVEVSCCSDEGSAKNMTCSLHDSLPHLSCWIPCASLPVTKPVHGMMPAVVT